MRLKRNERRRAQAKLKRENEAIERAENARLALARNAKRRTALTNKNSEREFIAAHGH
jgi:hypothetical protein